MLIWRITQGDQLAMRTLFGRHRVPLYRWLLRLVGDQALAEDLLSDGQVETDESPEHGEVIDLGYFHGKSVKEVAEIVGIATATAKTRMFYARKKLADFVAFGAGDSRGSGGFFIARRFIW
jgi:DNA-directed RNA polymerase specialized sigma24 family protein